MQIDKSKWTEQGKFQYRKHRAYVIHKMIDDLFVIRQVPSSWQVLKAEHVYKLVQYWKKRHINPSHHHALYDHYQTFFTDE